MSRQQQAAPGPVSTAVAAPPAPSSWRRWLALAIGLAGALGTAVALGLLELALMRRYPLGWQLGTGATAAIGLALVGVATRLARLPPRRALIALLGSLLLVVPLAALVRDNVAGGTSYAPAKRTMADLRNLGVALESRAIDANGYPQTTSFDELARVLEGSYTRKVPREDGWGRPLVYQFVAGADGERYFVGSAGADGKWQHPTLSDYRDAASSAPGDDIVYSNGGFVVVPVASAAPR